MHIEHRLEPWFRPQLNWLLREPSARLIQFFINLQRKDESLNLAEERIYPDEEQSLNMIIDLLADQMRGHFKPGGYERSGNTKTHGIVRATVSVRDDLPDHFVEDRVPDPGPTHGMTVDIQPMVRDFYVAMGWHADGRPTPDKLRELGLERQFEIS